MILGPNAQARAILFLQVAVNEKLLILIAGLSCRRKSCAACWREQAATLRDAVRPVAVRCDSPRDPDHSGNFSPDSGTRLSICAYKKGESK